MASTNRGCKAITQSGGASGRVFRLFASYVVTYNAETDVFFLTQGMGSLVPLVFAFLQPWRLWKFLTGSKSLKISKR